MDLWTLHTAFANAQTILNPPREFTWWGPMTKPDLGAVRAAREFVAAHAPDLLAALDDGTITDRSSLCAWWNAKYPHDQHPHPPVRTAEDEAEVARDLARLNGTSIARPVARDAPDYWHTAALDGGAL